MARIVGKGFSYNDLLLVPKYNNVFSRRDVSLKTRVTKNFSIDIPFLAANMDSVCDSEMAISLGRIGGLGVIHRFLTIEEQAREIRKVKSAGLICAAAIGVKDFEERGRSLVEAGIDILVLDVAHGHSERAGKALNWLKKLFPKVDIMVGNIATKEAARYFLNREADAVKVGIGPGSLCTTRIMTGAGIPQLTAIMDVYEEIKGRIPICADGGIKFPGDVVKAIGAGASCVMVGGILAGCKEAPGEIIEKEGKKYKCYRGMASFDATIKKLEIDGEKHREVISVEGEKTFVEITGSVEDKLKSFLGGLASGMTYLGVSKIDDFCGKADFIEISNEGLKESCAHGLNKN